MEKPTFTTTQCTFESDKETWRDRVEKLYEEIYCGDSGYTELELFILEERNKVLDEVKKEVEKFMKEEDFKFVVPIEDIESILEKLKVNI